MHISEIVKAYRLERGNKRPLSYRAFAESLKHDLPNLDDLKFQSIEQWEKGRHEPATETILYIWCMTYEGDWRNDFAADLMAARMPAAWHPQGEIGKRILGNK